VNGVRSDAIQETTWNTDEILHGNHGVHFKCERCGAKFSNSENGHMLGRNGENDPGGIFIVASAGLILRMRESWRGIWWRVARTRFALNAFRYFIPLGRLSFIGSRSIFNPSSLSLLESV